MEDEKLIQKWQTILYTSLQYMLLNTENILYCICNTVIKSQIKR